MKRCALLTVALTLAACSSGRAAVITFDAFPNGTPAPFAAGIEQGFTITGVNEAIWNPAFGFPTPIVFAPAAPTPEPATLAVFGALAAGAFGLRRRQKAAATA